MGIGLEKHRGYIHLDFRVKPSAVKGYFIQKHQIVFGFKQVNTEEVVVILLMFDFGSKESQLRQAVLPGYILVKFFRNFF